MDRASDHAGVQVGRYTLVDKLRDGALGEQWAAFVEAAEGPDAVATVRWIPASTTSTKEAREGLAAAVRAGRGFEHELIVTLDDVVPAEEGIGLVSTYVEGETLRALLWRAEFKRRAMPASIALRIALDLLDTLDVATDLAEGADAGAAGLHADSVLVTTAGHAQLLELALCRYAATAEPWAREPMLACYQAPEVLQRGVEVDTRADVFSIGVLMWEMLKNRPLFKAATFEGVVRNVMGARVARLDRGRPTGGEPISSDIADVVEQALNRTPESRFETLREMAEAIRNSGEEIAAAAEVAEFVAGFARESLESQARAMASAEKRVAEAEALREKAAARARDRAEKRAAEAEAVRQRAAARAAARERQRASMAPTGRQKPAEKPKGLPKIADPQTVDLADDELIVLPVSGPVAQEAVSDEPDAEQAEAAAGKPAAESAEEAAPEPEAESAAEAAPEPEAESAAEAASVEPDAESAAEAASVEPDAESAAEAAREPDAELAERDDGEAVAALSALEKRPDEKAADEEPVAVAEAVELPLERTSRRTYVLVGVAAVVVAVAGYFALSADSTPSPAPAPSAPATATATPEPTTAAATAEPTSEATAEPDAGEELPDAEADTAPEASTARPAPKPQRPPRPWRPQRPVDIYE